MRKKKSSRGLSLKATTALIIIVFLFGFGGTMWFYAINKVVNVQVYDIRIELVNEKRIGFNVDPTLDFGKLPVAGGQVKKVMKIVNEKDCPVNVRILVKGDVAQFIRLDDNDFVMEPGEDRDLAIYAIVPEGFGKPGVYTGKAKVTFLKP